MPNLIYCIVLAALVGCKLTSSKLAQDETIGSKMSLAQYNALCSASNVPLPARPLFDKTFWPEAKKRPFSATYPHFANFQGNSILYEHESTNGGGCLLAVANLRKEPSNIKYLTEAGETKFIENNHQTDITGAICWSKKGEVCFWEDIDVPLDLADEHHPYTISDSNTSMHPLSGEISQPCTECHVGENPFVGAGELGEPSLRKFPSVPLTKIVGEPSGWELRPKRDDLNCAQGCHTIVEPTPDYCGLALDMMRNGLMLGSEFGLEPNFIHNQLKPKIVRPVPSSLPDTESCKKWRDFLVVCQSVEKGNPGLYAQNAENLGRCL